MLLQTIIKRITYSYYKRDTINHYFVRKFGDLMKSTDLYVMPTYCWYFQDFEPR